MFFRILHRHYDVSILLLRLAIAAIFLAHGSMKVANFESLPVLMKILAVAEPVGGAAMVVGLLTRWAGLGLGIIMLGAIYTKIMAMGVGFTGPGAGWEFDLLILVSCIMIMTTGAGKWSMDAVLKLDRA